MERICAEDACKTTYCLPLLTAAAALARKWVCLEKCKAGLFTCREQRHTPRHYVESQSRSTHWQVNGVGTGLTVILPSLASHSPIVPSIVAFKSPKVGNMSLMPRMVIPGCRSIAKCATAAAADDGAPLKVISPRFTVRSVEQSSNMPGGENTIRVSLRPNVLLSKMRRSFIVIDGLRGTRTFEKSLPITVEQGTGIAPEASWRQSTGTLTMMVDGDVGTSSDLVISFELENGFSPQKAVESASVMALGDAPIGAASLDGSVMHIADLRDAEEIVGVCTCPFSSSNTSCECTTSFEGIALNRSLYTMRVELQCNSGAVNLTINTVKQENNSTQRTRLSGVQQLPSSCHDQCLRYHTILDWTSIDPDQMRVDSADSKDGSLRVDVNADGLQMDYCGAGDILKAIVTLRVSAS